MSRVTQTGREIRTRLHRVALQLVHNDGGLIKHLAHRNITDALSIYNDSSAGSEWAEKRRTTAQIWSGAFVALYASDLSAVEVSDNEDDNQNGNDDDDDGDEDGVDGNNIGDFGENYATDFYMPPDESEFGQLARPGPPSRESQPADSDDEEEALVSGEDTPRSTRPSLIASPAADRPERALRISRKTRSVVEPLGAHRGPRRPRAERASRRNYREKRVYRKVRGGAQRVPLTEPTLQANILITRPVGTTAPLVSFMLNRQRVSRPDEAEILEEFIDEAHSARDRYILLLYSIAEIARRQTRGQYRYRTISCKFAELIDQSEIAHLWVEDGPRRRLSLTTANLKSISVILENDFLYPSLCPSKPRSGTTYCR